MADDPRTESDDESLAFSIMCGERAALGEVLAQCLQLTKDLLTGIYGTTLQPAEIDEAVSTAALKLVKKAHQYDRSKGSIGGWFFTIAQSTAIDIIRRQKRDRRRVGPLGPEDEPFVDCDVETDLEPTEAEQQRLDDLAYVIKHKLEGLQQAIIKADLAAGDVAEASRLAEKHGTTKNSIYVSRHKARERIREEMLELKKRRERHRGKNEYRR